MIKLSYRWTRNLVIFCVILFALFLNGRPHAGVQNLVKNSGFEELSSTDSAGGLASHSPTHYELKGNAFWGYLGSYLDFATDGIIFPGASGSSGNVGQKIEIDQSQGRWLTFRFRGLAEDGFSIAKEDDLKMKMEFFSKGGTDYLDCASKPIFGEIEIDRKNLTVNGDFHKGGAAVWRSYEMEELIPFPEVDAVRISVTYEGASGTGQAHEAFLIDDLSLTQHAQSETGKIDPATAHNPITGVPVNADKLVSLGGRWYYLPKSGETVQPQNFADNPLEVTEANSDQLFYKSDILINPFKNNMTAWLRKGYKDLLGNIITEDRFIPDNVVLSFRGDGFLTVKSRNLPNHPTAAFPGLRNPSYIQELDRTYHIPLEPVLNPSAISTDATDSNHALPMGAIGIAVNGVVFYNPFDAGMRDASNIMDYCCGHPSPDNRYHYHKYPICVNTAFVDKGDAPSQVIGFAFDGFPIYGPYQSAGVMAKDSTTNPLSSFNACYDDVRGWHYHVTPGKFPYVIGGFIGQTEASNFDRMQRHPRPEW